MMPLIIGLIGRGIRALGGRMGGSRPTKESAKEGIRRALGGEAAETARKHGEKASHDAQLEGKRIAKRRRTPKAVARALEANQRRSRRSRRHY